MTDGEPSVRAVSESSPEPSKMNETKRGLHWEELVFGGLVLLSLIGIAIADYSARSGLTYWLWMVPVFFAASVHAGWTRARRKGLGLGEILSRQALHWAPLVLAFYATYALEQSGRLNREDAGLVALLALALTTFLAGVHFDWRLGLLGGLLVATVVAAALVEEFFWLLVIPAAAACVAVVLWRRRFG